MSLQTVASGLYARFQHLLHELGKFGVVGILAFLVDSGIYAALLLFDVHAVTAKVISTAIAASAAFVGNRYWTWRHRERSGLLREYLLYFFFNAAGLGIQIAVLVLTTSALGSVWPIFAGFWAKFISAQIVGNGLATVFRFWAYRRFVFVATAPTPAEATR